MIFKYHRILTWKVSLRGDFKLYLDLVLII